MSLIGKVLDFCVRGPEFKLQQRQKMSPLHVLSLLVSKTTDIPKKALCLTDLHCTNTVPHCTGHWYILYSTVHHCTFLLNCTVQYWTILYVSTDMHCTVLYNAVRFDWLVLYSTEPYCTGYWHALYTTEQYRTGILTHTVHNCTALNGDTDTHCTLLYSNHYIMI